MSIGYSHTDCDCCDHTRSYEPTEYEKQLNKERQEKIRNRTNELLRKEYERLRKTGKYSNIWINKKIRDLYHE